MSLVNKTAPKFQATAVLQGKKVSHFSLEQYVDKQYVVFFFFPKAFTGVCQSEVVEFQKSLPEFAKRNVAVVGCSVDSDDVLLEFTKQLAEKNVVPSLDYPIVADMSKTISTNYEVLGGDYFYDEEGRLAFEGAPIALRGTFLLDKKGFIRHLCINHFPLGRGVEETLRMVDALHHVDTTGEACMVNFKKA